MNFARQRFLAKRQLCGRGFTSSSSKSNKPPPPLPPNPSPAKAKQEYLKSEDPIVKMTRLQKELDVVRDRMAERVEAKLQKSVWRRLTDPLRRHSHSWINVGAVLLAYVLAHNLYMSAKEKRAYKEQLDDAAEKRDIYQQAMRDLLKEETLKDLSDKCLEEVSLSDNKTSLSWWNRSKPSQKIMDDEAGIIMQVLQRELKDRLGDHVLTDEERRIQDMQIAWQESQQQLVVVSPEQELVEAVLGGDTKEITAVPQKQQRRVISM